MAIDRLQVRRGTATEWTTANPVLADGEPGFERGTGKVKYGDGVTAWASLPYASQGPAGVADDASIAAQVSSTTSATRGALNATYAPMRLAKPGNRVAYLGDSITQSSWITSQLIQGASYPLYAGLLSRGRLLTVANAGVSGDKTSQMLARFDADVTPSKPNTVMVMGGRNDILGAVPIATFQANIGAIVAKIRAIPAVPVIGTIPPTGEAPGQPNTIKWNNWLRLYAASEGITVVDFYAALVDPATGGYLAAYNSDGVHPNAPGYVVMGQLVADTLGPLVPAFGPPLAQDNNDTSQLFPNNPIMLTDAGADGVPDGWFAYGGSSGYAHALITQAGVAGKMMQVTQTANADLRIITRDFTGFAAGDKLAISGSVVSNGGVQAEVKLTFNGATGANTPRPCLFNAAVTLGTFYQEFTVPAGTTSITVDCIVYNGTGVVSFGQITPINLTALGL